MATAAGFSTKDMKDERATGWKGLLTTAGCSRCGGFMVVEPCFDFRVQRCVQCGDLVDPVILQNRQHGSAPTQRTNRVGQHHRAA